jgi:hypothetical protein
MKKFGSGINIPDPQQWSVRYIKIRPPPPPKKIESTDWGVLYSVLYTIVHSECMVHK